jgi:hypothetical protein
MSWATDGFSAMTRALLTVVFMGVFIASSLRC